MTQTRLTIGHVRSEYLVVSILLQLLTLQGLENWFCTEGFSGLLPPLAPLGAKWANALMSEDHSLVWPDLS